MPRILAVTGLALAWGIPGALAVEPIPVRDWPSARFRDAAPAQPPCSCRGPAGSVEVGQEMCIATATGGRRARCVMVMNNTSWDVTTETCGSVAFLGR